MAVGLSPPRDLHPVAGIRLATTAAGIRYQGRNDLLLIELAPGSQTGAVFTTNAFCAAPVKVAKAHLCEAIPRYLLVNAGNANAGTGAEGLADARESCAALARLGGVPPQAVLPFSTGVIGERLPVDRLCAALPALLGGLRTEGWLAAAEAIMTTDTVPKAVSRTVAPEGRELRLTGIAKGAGMICPHMATMLSFVATDAHFPDPLYLQAMLREVMDDSFNAITVDGDTSTNDACVLMATGRSAVTIGPGQGAARQQAFGDALQDVMRSLAQAIVRDGEGATRFVTVQVEGARDQEEARRVAYMVAHSPLVKTACFAGDPNWGRILAAVGRAGIAGLDIDRVAIWLDRVRVVTGGGRDPAYLEADGARVMAQPEFTLRVDLGRGREAARVWTTDLSYEYVRINAEYRS